MLHHKKTTVWKVASSYKIVVMILIFDYYQDICYKALLSSGKMARIWGDTTRVP